MNRAGVVVDPILEATVEAKSPGAFETAWDEACVAAGLEGAPRKLTFRPLQVHYRPFRRTRLVFEGSRTGKRRLRYFYVQIYARRPLAEKRLQAAFAIKSPRRTVGPPAFLIERWNAVAWEIPNGPRLRTMRSLTQRKALKRMLARIGLEAELEPRFELPRLFRYVPRKRAVLRWDLPTREGVKPLFIKAYDCDDYDAAVANLAWLTEREAALGFRLPRVLAEHPRRRVLFLEALPGRTLTASLLGEEPGALHAVGRALASLHALPERPSTVVWSPLAELHALERAVEDVTLILPGLRPAIDAIRDGLADRARRLDSAAVAPIHGNLFGDQVLLEDSRVGMVDWDDLAAGDPHYDLGRLAAHAMFLGLPGHGEPERRPAALEELFAGYEGGGGAVAPEALRWNVVTALLMRAKISALRTLVPGWRELIEEAVERAGAVLDGTEPIG